MRYEASKPTVVTFDTSDELQAMGWAASEMRSVEADNSDAQSAYYSALCAGFSVGHDGNKDFTLHGAEAEAVLSTLQRWVAAGPPQERGEVTDAARIKSYRTACAIVAKTIELPGSTEHDTSS